MKKLFFLLLLISTSSYGQLWETVVESETNTVYSIDSSSVKREGDIVTYWELVDYKTPLKSGNLVVVSSKSKVIQDCKNNRFKVSDLIDYDGHNGMGNVVNVTMVSVTDWYKGTPDSVNSLLKERVCK